MKIIQGDSLTVLRSMPKESIDCVVTSPPYWGLRDYGVKGQLGLEPTIAEYLDTMLKIFDEIMRVLKPTGTVWVNLGDTYSMTSVRGGHKGMRNAGSMNYSHFQKVTMPSNRPKSDVPHKSLCMIPARFAIGMIERGWILRQEIIWAKPNPMPESVKDRCTKSHEMLYMFVKSRKYYYDAESIKTPSKDPNDDRGSRGNKKRTPTKMVSGIRASGTYPMANKRDVWTINSKPYKEAHFATYPEKLVEAPIRAGCPLNGTVLDPFMGSGTTLLVAQREGRDSIGIELSREYIDIAKKRLQIK